MGDNDIYVYFVDLGPKAGFVMLNLLCEISAMVDEFLQLTEIQLRYKKPLCVVLTILWIGGSKWE